MLLRAGATGHEMRDVVTKTALRDGATKHLFKIEPESLEQLRHIKLNGRHVVDGGRTAAAVLRFESIVFDRSRPFSASSGAMRVNVGDAGFRRHGIRDGKPDAVS
jgi:hypothetical protein